MAEAAKAVADYINENNKQIICFTVMKDLGIVASLDPVANDQAFIDMVWNSNDNGAHLLRERVDRQEGRHITEYAEEIGLGTTAYERIEL